MTTDQIGAKQVYIVTNHHEVLEAWATIRQTLPSSPILITLDHHTDTVLAFRHLLCSRNNVMATSAERFTEMANAECQKIDFRDLTTVRDAILTLQNDEHIDAAIRAGIIDHAYAITYSDFSGTPRRQFRHLSPEERTRFIIENDMESGPFEPPFTKIFHVASDCAVGCEADTHTDVCHVEHSAQAIETIYLRDKLRQIAEMSSAFEIQNVLDQTFILDIDLDYFHSSRSIAPADPTVFYDLIRRAVAITIATEPNYVKRERLEGETIDSDMLLEALKEHIKKAQS